VKVRMLSGPSSSSALSVTTTVRLVLI
jgi:hypothetical protein